MLIYYFFLNFFNKLMAIMKTPIFFVSDNHFQKRSDSSEMQRKEKFFNLLEHVKDRNGTLVIGGDFFDFWFDFSLIRMWG